MNSINEEFNFRKDEINQYLDFLKNLETGTYTIMNKGETINTHTTLKTTQKSCAILLLYNVVESIVTKLLVKIHDTIKSENVGFFHLNNEIKDLTLIYFNSVINKKDDFHNAVPFVQSLIQMLLQNSHFQVTYKEMEKYYSLYSGNLDSQKISKIVGKYGIIFDRKVKELQTIKDGRNKLAHGEVSFEEYGRTLTIQQLEVLKDRTFNYLENLIAHIIDYIQNKHFKIQI